MDEGVPTRLDHVAADKLGQKLRLTGQCVLSVGFCAGAIHRELHRVLAYDAYTGVVFLRTGDVGVLVDASNCVSAWTGWLKERLCTVQAVGYLERALVGLRYPWTVP